MSINSNLKIRYKKEKDNSEYSDAYNDARSFWIPFDLKANQRNSFLANAKKIRAAADKQGQEFISELLEQELSAFEILAACSGAGAPRDIFRLRRLAAQNAFPLELWQKLFVERTRIAAKIIATDNESVKRLALTRDLRARLSG